ncbi:MAG: MerR family transcriptional regulator [Planctomycetes bacterium]|nr:MerR family transcriptional regulator [Planctomycetota bacterium]
MNVPAGTQVAMATLLKAGELARRTGITRQALHIYVQMGLLRPVLSSQGGHRLYDDQSVERVALIRKLCASGYTLKDIREIFIKDR